MDINELCNESTFQDSKGEGPTYAISARVGEEDSGPLGAWVLASCSLTGTWALPVGDLRQRSFKLGRSSGLQFCPGSSSSRMQVMNVGIWAAQAVVHSSGPGKLPGLGYRSQANRYGGKSSYRAGWLQGPEEEEAWDCRKHPVFCIRLLALRFRRQREKGALVQTRVPEAAGSACLFRGAHRRPTWPPTASAGWASWCGQWPR